MLCLGPCVLGFLCGLRSLRLPASPPPSSPLFPPCLVWLCLVLLFSLWGSLRRSFFSLSSSSLAQLEVPRIPKKRVRSGLDWVHTACATHTPRCIRVRFLICSCLVVHEPHGSRAFVWGTVHDRPLAAAATLSSVCSKLAASQPPLVMSRGRPRSNLALSFAERSRKSEPQSAADVQRISATPGPHPTRLCPTWPGIDQIGAHVGQCWACFDQNWCTYGRIPTSAASAGGGRLSNRTGATWWGIRLGPACRSRKCLGFISSMFSRRGGRHEGPPREG